MRLVCVPEIDRQHGERFGDSHVCGRKEALEAEDSLKGFGPVADRGDAASEQLPWRHVEQLRKVAHLGGVPRQGLDHGCGNRIGRRVGGQDRVNLSLENRLDHFG